MLTRSDLVSMPEVTMDNVIFLGSSTGNRQIQALSASQPIVLEPEGIRNLNPRPGEPAFIPDSSDNDEAHALISLMPGIYGHGELLYFSGNQIASVMAAVQAFTDPTLARTLVSKLTTPAGFPRYYQVVLKVKVHGQHAHRDFLHVPPGPVVTEAASVGGQIDGCQTVRSGT